MTADFNLRFAAGEPVETCPLIRHGGAEQRLEIIIFIRRRFRQVGDGGVELGDSIQEQSMTILECADLEKSEMRQLAANVGDVEVGGSDVGDSLADGRGDNIR